jgi:hypothetical protein
VVNFREGRKPHAPAGGTGRTEIGGTPSELEPAPSI